MIKKLFRDLILIKKKEKETISKGGIYIPDSVEQEDTFPTAEVFAVGPGTKDDPMDVSVGDTILHMRYVGTDLELPEGKFKVIRQSEVIAIV